MTESPIAIIADDLTGALDAAAVFTRGGETPFVSVHGDVILPEDCSIVSINADTRRLSEQDAEEVMTETALRILESPANLRFVKIDSTLRGHPAVEITAAARAMEAEIVMVAPSFPATGRVVRNGRLLVHGVPLADTEVGRDPLSPRETSRVSDVFGRNANAAIALVRLQVVRSDQLASALSTLTANAVDAIIFAICDAETDSDLDSLVSAAVKLEANGTSVLFAGSAGLATALSAATESEPNYNAKSLVPTVQPPVLTVTASQRSLADDQIVALTESGMAERHIVDFEVSDAGDVSGARYNQQSIADSLAAHRNVVLRATVDVDLATLSPALVRSIANTVTRQLGETVASLTSKTRPGALVVIGGDTAFGILSAVGARGIFLAAEPLPGVPVGTVSGGQLDGVPIATKAGAFGHDRTLVQVIQHLTASRPTNGHQR